MIQQATANSNSQRKPCQDRMSDEAPNVSVNVSLLCQCRSCRVNYKFIPQNLESLQIHTPNYIFIPLHQILGYENVIYHSLGYEYVIY